MSDVPDDIRENALVVARRWYHEEWDTEEYIQQQLVDDIAAALLAEREAQRERDAIRCDRQADIFKGLSKYPSVEIAEGGTRLMKTVLTEKILTAEGCAAAIRKNGSGIGPY